MRGCVFGAGATGGHFAAKLGAAGHDVSVVARGPHLDAIAANGLTLKSGERTIRAKVRAASSAADLGEQDVVIVGVKTPGLAAMAGDLKSLLGPDTLVIFPQNGMTWWYPVGLPDGRPDVPDLPVFRLGDRFLDVMDRDQVVGGIIYSANEVESPGVVLNNSPARNRLTIQSLTGRREERVSDFRKALEEAGILSEPPRDIRESMWQKLLMNMSGSVIAVATGNRSSISRNDPALGEVYVRVVREGMKVSAAHGYPLDNLDPEKQRVAMRDHKPSLLQDYEQGRPMEVGEMVLAPQAFARAAGIDTPTLDALAAVVARLARDRGLYG